METSGDVRLGAVGVGFAVDRYYHLSARAELDDLATVLIDQIVTTVLAELPAKS